MAIVRRRLGSNKRLLTLLPTRMNFKKRKVIMTSDEEEDTASTVVVSARWHDDNCNSSTTTTSCSCYSSPPHRDCRFETVVTPPPPEMKKRVRFDLSQPQKEQYPHVVDEDYLQRHKTDLWYPKAHRQEQQQQVQEIIASFKKTHPEIVSKFAAMYKNIVAGNDEVKWCPPSSSMVTLPLELRGLEWGITPQLKLRRKRHFRHVLQCAEDPSLPESFQQIMRHTTSQNSSRTAVVMAQWYAAQHPEPDATRKQDEKEVIAAKLTGGKSTTNTFRGCLALRQDASVKPMKGLPPRQPLQSNRIRLWQR